jgi:hypothetical protein
MLSRATNRKKRIFESPDAKASTPSGVSNFAGTQTVLPVSKSYLIEHQNCKKVVLTGPPHDQMQTIADNSLFLSNLH